MMFVFCNGVDGLASSESGGCCVGFTVVDSGVVSFACCNRGGRVEVGPAETWLIDTKAPEKIHLPRLALGFKQLFLYGEGSFVGGWSIPNRFGFGVAFY
jgi:hypothetical protein